MDLFCIKDSVIFHLLQLDVFSEEAEIRRIYRIFAYQDLLNNTKQHKKSQKQSVTSIMQHFRIYKLDNH